jgi:hypothetical protein
MSTDTIEALYGAFARLDGRAMQACYADDAVFSDPVFDLHGRTQIGGMWRMLCDSASQHGAEVWRIETRGIEALGPGASQGRAHWEAWYRFSATGRDVHNVIDATFTFDPNHRILSHRDRFDFWRWSRQALGLPGTLLGWTPMLRAKVQAKARGRLEAYLAKHAI